MACSLFCSTCRTPVWIHRSSSLLQTWLTELLISTRRCLVHSYQQLSSSTTSSTWEICPTSSRFLLQVPFYVTKWQYAKLTATTKMTPADDYCYRECCSVHQNALRPPQICWRSGLMKHKEFTATRWSTLLTWKFSQKFSGTCSRSHLRMLNLKTSLERNRWSFAISPLVCTCT